MPFCLLLLVLTAFPAAVLAQSEVSGQLGGSSLPMEMVMAGEAGIGGVVVCSRSEWRGDR